MQVLVIDRQGIRHLRLLLLGHAWHTLSTTGNEAVLSLRAIVLRIHMQLTVRLRLIHLGALLLLIGLVGPSSSGIELL